MYYKLSEDEIELIKKVSKRTFTKYDLIGDFIPVDNMILAIEDLIYETEKIEDEYHHLEKNLEDNYIRRPISDYTGDSYDDRF